MITACIPAILDGKKVQQQERQLLPFPLQSLPKMSVEKPQSSSNPYVKVANFTGLYRHTKTDAYYAVKKIGGKRRERSLGTADRKIAERRFKEWVDSFGKVDSEVEKTTVRQLVAKFEESSRGYVKNTQVTTNAIIKSFRKWLGSDFDVEVRKIRPSQLDEWLAEQEPRLRNTTFNRYAGFLKQLFALATKDKIIPESPAKALRTPWKRPQQPRRHIPSRWDAHHKRCEGKGRRCCGTGKSQIQSQQYLGGDNGSYPRKPATIEGRTKWHTATPKCQ